MSFEWNMILRTTILLAGTALLSLPARWASASVRHAIWATGLSFALILPAVSVLLPPFQVITIPSSMERTTTYPAPVPAAARATPVRSAAVPPLSPPRAAEPEPVQLPWRELAWALGVLLVLLRSIVAFRDLRKLERHSRLIEHDLPPRVELRLGGEAIPPMTWGLFRHVILLPSAAAEWTGARIRLVLAHELAHIRRRDGWSLLLVQAVCAIYWFNPLVWYAAYRMRIEREHACDDQVLNLGANAGEYADHLLAIARGINSSGSPVAVSMVHPSQLETRLRAILDSRLQRRTLSRSGGTLLLTGTALATLLIASLQLTTLALPLIPQLLLEPPIIEPAAEVPEPLPPPAPPTPPAAPEFISFVNIPPGEFTMGCGLRPDWCGKNEQAHLVRITKGFEMGKYEVTQAEWESVMNTNPSDFRGPDLPVEQVSWNEAQEFLSKLNSRRDGYYYRLPTEAEWEYAAKAGTTGFSTSLVNVPPNSPGDARLDAIGWNTKNSEGHTHPVGQKQPNAWGLYDMHGNVVEWVQDWYGADYYASSPRSDPRGPLSGQDRILRGGSWDVFAGFLTVFFRNQAGPGIKYDFIGFRCVRELD